MAAKILVADDEPDIANLARMILEKQGYSVLMASNGVEALQKAENTMPDLILLDVVMPAKTGWEVCKTLKAQDSTKSIRVVIFTVLAKFIGDENSKKYAEESGCDGYLSKPFTPRELITEVRKYIV
ncbi:MAG: response regulator [archaeon]